MAEHNDFGKLGEKLAADYLTQKGYRIVATNWHHGHEEIDIVAYDGDELVVVEVKTRQSRNYGDPEIAVSKSKQRSIIRVAEAYIIENDLNVQTRFDVISIVANQYEQTIEHIEDAFYPTLK